MNTKIDRAECQNKILHILGKYGEMTPAELMQKTGLSKTQFTEALSALRKAKAVWTNITDKTVMLAGV